jgi:hypothetical protein
MKQKHTKAMDMRFYWLCNRVAQGQFEIYWEPGKNNLADYPTKHHSPAHHKRVRPIYLYDPKTSPRDMQGCVKLLQSASMRKTKVEPSLLESGCVNLNHSGQTTAIRTRGARSNLTIHGLLVANSRKNQDSLPPYSTFKRMKLHGPLILMSRKAQ